MSAPFDDSLRRRKSAAFDLEHNSTARHTVTFPLWGRPVTAYANANLSVYSAQTCNAKCAFCVEELRPASRGRSLTVQRTIEADDERYFAALDEVLVEVAPLSPTLSITGGEPSKDPRLSRILTAVGRTPCPRRTLTTNGSGLLDACGTDGARSRRVVDAIADASIAHLNISRAHPEHDENGRLMALREGLTDRELSEVVAVSKAAGTRVRLSCVLLDGAVETLPTMCAYLAFARSIGVDNVIFRQLMHVDRRTVADNYVVRYSDARRARLEPLLDEVSADPRFTFVKQIVGYYYYVEVWRYGGMDVVFEEADLAQLEQQKRARPELVHELVFHPNARLCSTWQPWDGVLGPRTHEAVAAQ